MATVIVSKVLSALPGTLVANTIYLVRVGTGIDIYVVDSTGTIAYKTNASLGSTVSALTNSAGVVNVDLSKGDYFTLTLAANVTSLTFSNLPSAGSARTIDITLTQDATGGRTFALPASFHAIGASDTAIKTTASKKTKIIATTLDGGATWAYSMGAVA
jgi:hypothetical protein